MTRRDNKLSSSATPSASLLERLADLIAANDASQDEGYPASVRAGCALDDFCMEHADELVAALRSERKPPLSDLVPTTWLDPLLTGPNAMLKGSGPWPGLQVENLLRAIKQRIADAEGA